jgi:hypothetical protein
MGNEESKVIGIGLFDEKTEGIIWELELNLRCVWRAA